MLLYSNVIFCTEASTAVTLIREAQPSNRQVSCVVHGPHEGYIPFEARNSALHCFLNGKGLSRFLLRDLGVKLCTFKELLSQLPQFLHKQCDPHCVLLRTHGHFVFRLPSLHATYSSSVLTLSLRIYRKSRCQPLWVLATLACFDTLCSGNPWNR